MKTLNKMIKDIEDEVRITRFMIGKDALDKNVMEAMRKVPREKFVPPGMRAFAHDNGPLSIGNNQTISQPYIVALMTDMLQLDKGKTVLEIGTGCGYQTAILSLLAKQVYSIEVIKELSEEAAQRLQEMNYTNIETRTGNGYDGWPEHAPYDAIIVTAAAPSIPQTLIEQLKPGRKIAIPVGQPHMHQELMLVEKDESGAINTTDLLGVAFVPMVES